MLCLWLLQRLQRKSTASFLLLPVEDGSQKLAGSTLRKLAPEFTGGWVTDGRKLALSLGPKFRGDPFTAISWIDAVKGFASGSPTEDGSMEAR